MLRVSGLSVVHGGLHALDRVSLEVRSGEFVTIVGPNGAGKTTLLRAVSGAVPAAAGRVEYQGQDLGRLAPAARARLGIGHVPEGRKVFPSLTVLENLEMGSYRTEAKRRRAESLQQVGGNSRPSIRRAARYGQSWHALGVPAGELPPLLGYLREQLRANGRDEGACGLSLRYGMRIVGLSGDGTRRDLEEPGRVFVGTAAQVVEQLKPVMDLRPADAIFHCRTGSHAEVLETMERLAGEVWPALRG